jgi:hypothetical protein
MVSRLGRCGSAQSLWSIIEAKLLFAALAQVESEESWRSKEVGESLTRLFVSIQAHVQRFEETRVAPANEAESNLIARIVEHKAPLARFKTELKVYSVLVELRQHELLRHFLLFLLAAFQRCPLLLEFCDKTIASGPLDEQTWERLKLTLEHACEFLGRFADSLKDHAGAMVAINRAVCTETNFAEIAIRAFF